MFLILVYPCLKIEGDKSTNIKYLPEPSLNKEINVFLGAVFLENSL